VNQRDPRLAVMSCSIDQMRASDWEQVSSIYLEGIRSGHSTFETTIPTWDQWDAGHLPFARLVIRNGDLVSGWAALSPTSRRPVYRGVAETTVYVTESQRGRGIGRALLEALIDESEKNDIWTLQASIFPENTASLELHLHCGFRELGRRERIAQLNGIWRDTILLERRSSTVGI
jgi:L-amino acid N-acyltransferase YncA